MGKETFSTRADARMAGKPSRPHDSTRRTRREPYLRGSHADGVDCFLEYLHRVAAYRVCCRTSGRCFSCRRSIRRCSRAIRRPARRGAGGSLRDAESCASAQCRDRRSSLMTADFLQERAQPFACGVRRPVSNGPVIFLGKCGSKSFGNGSRRKHLRSFRPDCAKPNAILDLFAGNLKCLAAPHSHCCHDAQQQLVIRRRACAGLRE